MTSRPLSGSLPARAACLGAVSILLLWPPAATAQQLPGMPGSQGGTAEMHRAEFYAHVMDKVRVSFEGWHASWSGDDAGELAELYAEDAVLVLPGGTPIWGRPAIQEALPPRLRDAGEAQVGIGDVSASGRMAYVGGRFQIEIQEGDQAGRQLEGFHSTVFFRTGGDWLIRSQVFHPDPDPARRDPG